jgi:hypothetical protein
MLLAAGRSCLPCVCKYGFRSCCHNTWNWDCGMWGEVGWPVFFNVDLNSLLRWLDAALMSTSNVLFLFTVVPTYWLQSHYGNQSEKIHFVSISRNRNAGINCVLYKDSWKMVTSIEHGTVFIDTGWCMRNDQHFGRWYRIWYMIWYIRYGMTWRDMTWHDMI